MSRRTQSACAFTPAAGCAAALVLAAAGSAAAATPNGVVDTTALPLTGFSSLVADSVHQHVFVSGAATDPVVATDLAGEPVATLTALTGATSLALSYDSAILYAAIGGTDEIAAVDTATLQEVAVYFTGAGHDPVKLAVVGHDVWLSYGGVLAAGIGVLDPQVPTVNVTAEPAFYSAPVLAASPSAPNTLVAGDGGMSPSVIESFDVSSGSPVEIAKSNPWVAPDGCANLHQLAVASATDVVAACGAPYYGSSLSLSTMTEDAEYQTGPYVDSVAVARTSGTIALGLDAANSPVELFTPGDPTATATYPLAGAAVDGLAWSSDGSTLFAVTAPSTGKVPSLDVIDVP